MTDELFGKNVNPIDTFITSTFEKLIEEANWDNMYEICIGHLIKSGISEEEANLMWQQTMHGKKAMVTMEYIN